MPSSTGVVEQTNPKPLSGLFALKPRQVLLAELNAKAAPTMNPSIESKSVLIHSILCFLDSNSFSKTLKRFLSEAKIQDDSWKACSFNLEEIFSKNFQTCTTKSVILEKEVQPEINGDATVADDLKKKKKKKHDSNAELVPNGKDSNSVDGFGEVKEKKKKKKDLSESLDQVKEINSAELKETANNSEMDEQDKKDKDKKRRKNKSGPELHEIGKEQEQQGLIPSVTKEKGKKKKNKVDKSSLEEDEEKVFKQEKEKSKDENQKNKCIVEKCSIEGDNSKEEVIGKEKSSKKRKRSLSEENVETEILQESKISDPVIEVNSVKGDNGKSEKKKSIENGHASENQLQDSSVMRQDNEEDNSGAGRSAKKQRIDSEEPNSASNAFRRVKVEDVVFTDERLQDNSYWAKDGADIGYGARAQEVLGQVKGRGFRHEKTKKKRGSYRGGQIDLDSHSIKFNYSDEE